MARVNRNLADVGTRAADLVQWTLTDHLNTVCDIAQFDPKTGATTVINHFSSGRWVTLIYGGRDRVGYHAFGRVTSESNPAVDSLFLFTARKVVDTYRRDNNATRPFDVPTSGQKALSLRYPAPRGM